MEVLKIYLLNAPIIFWGLWFLVHIALKIHLWENGDAFRKFKLRRVRHVIDICRCKIWKCVIPSWNAFKFDIFAGIHYFYICKLYICKIGEGSFECDIKFLFGEGVLELNTHFWITLELNKFLEILKTIYIFFWKRLYYTIVIRKTLNIWKY